jgi:hypothetical protein
MLNEMVYILNQDYDVVLMIDDYTSLVWSKRYCELGDFVLDLPLKYVNHPELLIDRYILLVDERLPGFMIIEGINPVQEEGKLINLRVTGSSAEKMLDWRTTIDELSIDGNVYPVINTLVTDNIFTPTRTERRIPFFTTIVNDTLGVKSVTDIYASGSLYSIINALCERVGWGLEIKLIPGPSVELRIYEGRDRSYGQSVNDPVIFSENFDNIDNSDYLVTTKDERTLVWVLTSHDTIPWHMAFVGSDEPYGTRRREMILEARDLGNDLSPQDVVEIAQGRGADTIRTYRSVAIFDGTVTSEGSFFFGKDYFLGDIVQCEVLGIPIRARVVEVVREISEGRVSYDLYLDFSLDDGSLLWRDAQPPQEPTEETT